LHTPRGSGTLTAQALVTRSSVSIGPARACRIGASYDAGITTFAVWAPGHQQVELVVGAEPHAAERRALVRDERDYWSAEFDDLGPGTLYRFRLNGSDDQVFPDPASRFQPHGVHGPSQVVDPSTFEWTDHDWCVPTLEDLIIYELHVGTFTPDGTFDGVADRLDYLADLGVTAIELMPVGDFPGGHNWGYDGVALFAPARCYGTPDSLRALVDAAHRRGLAVILDVVYNHFGPDGAYASAFTSQYFSDRHTSPWGRGINFDGTHSAEVRRFFIENALQWVLDFHLDGLRLDATHAIQDDSTPHFLAELTSSVRTETGRNVLFIAEDHRNLVHMMHPVESAGFGLDAVWADDFHHQSRVHVAHDRDGYYAPFSGSTADLAITLHQGWYYSGQIASDTGDARGTDPSSLEPPRFVICIQNHDQVGNRVDGARLHHQIDPASYRALSALLLLAPHTPLLFMGQEWATSAPFQFFTDHHEELGRKVTEGRRAEFARFEAFSARNVPDPQRLETFERSRLPWFEVGADGHAAVLRLYRRLLELRRTHPALSPRGRSDFDVQALDEHTIALGRMSADRSQTLLLVTRLSGEGSTCVAVDRDLETTLLTTEDREFEEKPRAIRYDRDTGTVHFERPAAIVLAREERR
jgi:maltooligosyltrehalose trehalohydrolase